MKRIWIFGALLALAVVGLMWLSGCMDNNNEIYFGENPYKDVKGTTDV